MITYEINRADMECIQRRLRGMEEKAPQVFKNAINRTARIARKKLEVGAQESYTVRTRGFNSRMRVQNATAGRLFAVIRSRGRTLTLTRFKTTEPPSGVRADVVKTGLKQIVGRQGIRAFKSRKQGLIMQRESQKRYPVHVLRSVSVPKMLEKVYQGERGIEGELTPIIEKTLRDEINAEIARLI